jgi:hypothetical protein
MEIQILCLILEASFLLVVRLATYPVFLVVFYCGWFRSISMLCCRSTVCVYILFVYIHWLSNYSPHFHFTVFPKCVGIPGSWFHSISHLTFEETFVESCLLCGFCLHQRAKIPCVVNTIMCKLIFIDEQC